MTRHGRTKMPSKMGQDQTWACSKSLFSLLDNVQPRIQGTVQSGCDRGRVEVMGCASSVERSLEPRRNDEHTLDDFETGRVLGKGAFSVCRAAVSKINGVRVAIKTVDKTSTMYNSQMVETELSILQRARHPSCMQLTYLFETMDSMHIVMERALGGTLQDRIDQEGTLKEFVAATIIIQLLDGLKHLHGMGICHRDVKPLNILMLSQNHDSPRYNTVKLTDYGLAATDCENYEECMDMVCGTPLYAAPEMLRIASEQSKTKYSAKVDVWSAGCTLYTMLCGASPFNDYSVRTVQLVQKIVAGEYRLPHDAWSAEAHDAVSHLMQLEPARRPTAKEAKGRCRAWKTSSRRRERAERREVAEAEEMGARNDAEVSFASTMSASVCSLKCASSAGDAESVRSVDTSVAGKGVRRAVSAANWVGQHVLHEEPADHDSLFVISRNAS